MLNLNHKKSKYTFNIRLTITVGLLLMLPISHAATYVNMVNSKHKILWTESSRLVDGMEYIQAKQFKLNIIADYQNIANLRRDYVLSTGYVHFFDPGVTYYGGEFIAGVLEPSSIGKPPSINLKFNFDFRSFCGRKGALTSVITLKHKNRDEYITLHQGSQQSPHAGGIEPIVIDCDQPSITNINFDGLFLGTSNNICLTGLNTGRRSMEVFLRLVDDIGVSKVDIQSDHSDLQVSSRQLSGSDLSKVSDGIYRASFNIIASNTSPTNGIKLSIVVTDLSGRRKSYYPQLNLSGVESSTINVNLFTPTGSIISIGKKTAFSGLIESTDCAIKPNSDVHWEIHKLPSKISSNGSIVNSGEFRIAVARRTPFIIPFNTDISGYYQLRMLKYGTVIIYKSAVVTIMPRLSSRMTDIITGGNQPGHNVQRRLNLPEPIAPPATLNDRKTDQLKQGKQSKHKLLQNLELQIP